MTDNPPPVDLAEFERMQSLAKANNALARMNATHRDEWRERAVKAEEALEQAAYLATRPQPDEIERLRAERDEAIAGKVHFRHLWEAEREHYRKATDRVHGLEYQLAELEKRHDH